MKVDIAYTLGYTRLDYINLVDESFNTWCIKIGKTFTIPLRALQVNAKLYNWFIANWERRIVNVFFSQNKEFINANIKAPDHYRDLFFKVKDSPNGINNIYPSVIIKQIKTEHYEKIKPKEES